MFNYIIYRNTQPRPKFCTECGKILQTKSMHSGFDAITGEVKMESYLLCSTLSESHDSYLLRLDEDDYWQTPEFTIQTLDGTILPAQKR